MLIAESDHTHYMHSSWDLNQGSQVQESPPQPSCYPSVRLLPIIKAANINWYVYYVQNCAKYWIYIISLNLQ